MKKEEEVERNCRTETVQKNMEDRGDIFSQSNTDNKIPNITYKLTKINS